MRRHKNIDVAFYGFLLNLYPRSYIREFKKLMKQAFSDMLKEDKPGRVWLEAIRELPGSLLCEHLENINGRKLERKDKTRLIMSVFISIFCGISGFFLSFFIGEGLMGVLGSELAILSMFICISIYNFIICFSLGRFSPNSVWFSGFFINIIVWTVLFGNLDRPGGFYYLWYGWIVLIISAFAGSIVGLISLRRQKGEESKNIL
jgi:hypothetical protein